MSSSSKFRRLLPIAVLGLAILAPAGLAEAKTHHPAAATHLFAKKSAKKKHHKKKHHKKHHHKKTKSTKKAALHHA